MIKRFRIKYSSHDWDCTIEFNTELFTQDLLQEYLDFFCWYYNKKGNLYAEYAKKLAKEIIYLSIEYNENGIIDEFKDMEGYPPLDGSMGVKLIRCDSFSFDNNEFSSKQLEVVS